tara:strand:- start:8148 stop:8477 length:330 start_codon:yes stop_codon:yes gene_type:complete
MIIDKFKTVFYFIYIFSMISFSHYINASNKILKKGDKILCLDGTPFLKVNSDVFYGEKISVKKFTQIKKYENWKLEPGAYYNPPNCRGIANNLSYIHTDRGLIIIEKNI